MPRAILGNYGEPSFAHAPKQEKRLRIRRQREWQLDSLGNPCNRRPS